MTLSALPSVFTGSYTLTFHARSADSSSDAHVSLSVAVGSAAGNGNRTDFVATGDTPSSVVYDPIHNAIYADMPSLSRVYVINAATRQILRSIPVPGGGGLNWSGLSITPDGKRILVSGAPQQVGWIDTDTQNLAKLEFLPQIQNGCCSSAPVRPGKPMILASGNVLFIGYSSIFNGIMEWKRSVGQVVGVNPDPKYSVYFAQDSIGARSADGTKVIFSTNAIPSDLAIFDSVSDTFTTTASAGYVYALAANPTGTQFAAAGDSEPIAILDNQLNKIGQAPVGGVLYGMVYSPDGKKLYVVSMPGNVPLISTIDTSTFQLIGQAPAYFSVLAFTDREPPFFVEKPMATDSSGLLFGAGDHGVAVDDSTYFQNISDSAIATLTTGIVNPAQGPQNSPTSVTIPTSMAKGSPSVWFGFQPGGNAVVNSSGQIQTAAPPAPYAGPVNVKSLAPDGTEGNVPNGFSYGVILDSTPVVAVPPSGGVLFDIYGYGLGSDSSPTPTLQLGSSSASIQKSILFPAEYVYGYPFPLDHVRATAPAGSPGRGDINVKSLAGTGTVPGGIHFLQSVNDYPSSDSFTFVLYDARRSQLYLSAGDHIDVFSLSSRTYVAPIIPPTLSKKLQMQGLALTPDGSKLLAANYSDNSVAVIDLGNPSSVQVTQVVPTGSSIFPQGPLQLVATNSNHVLVASFDNSHTFTGGGGGIYDIDLGTLAAKPVHGPFAAHIDADFLTANQDGSKVFLGIPNEGVFVLDVATNTWTTGPPQQAFEVAASGDGNVFVSDGLARAFETSLNLFDPAARLISVTGLPEYLDATPALSGIKLNDSGSLAYVGVTPSVVTEPPAIDPRSFVDIYDVQHHELRERIFLSEQFLPQEAAQNGLAIDGTGQNLFLLTKAGLTIVSLDSVPLSIGSITPTVGSAGATVILRGSGFSQLTTAMCNGATAKATFVDTDTLQVSLPASLPAGPVSISLSNPDGSTYTLDVAFTVN